MSEEKTTPAGAATDAGHGAGDHASAAGKAAGGPAPIVLIAVVVLALAAGAALGGLLVGPKVIQARHAAAVAASKDPHKKDKKKDKKKGKEGEAGKASVYKIDNIIVNPAGSSGGRFLMCSVVVQPEDDKLVDVLRDREVDLRDRVLTQLTSTTLDQLTGPGARDSLRARLAVTVRGVLDKEDRQAELKIFLPQFVIQ